VWLSLGAGWVGVREDKGIGLGRCAEINDWIGSTLLRLRALRKDRMVNNDGNASSSEAIDNVIFRLKYIR
jgi:hypothetical protein